MTERGTTGSLAGLVAIALLISSYTFGGPHAFDVLRPSERKLGQPELSYPAVEARLWENPLAVLDRYQSEQADPCLGSDRKAQYIIGASAHHKSEGRPEISNECRDRWKDALKAFKAELKDNHDVTMIAVLLPGGSLDGAEEDGRRTRYAVLTGLQVQGFSPDYSERMRILQMERCEGFGDPPKNQAGPDKTECPRMNILFETLTTDKGQSSDRRRVAIFWIDDTKIGKRWLSSLANLLQELRPGGNGVRLRIIGPFSSQSLIDALGPDFNALEEETNELEEEIGLPHFRKKLRTLAEINVISPRSTASASEILRSANLPDCAHPAEQDCLNDAFVRRIKKMAAKVKLDEDNLTSFFVRTVGTDDQLIDRVGNELCKRGLDERAPGTGRRVAVFAEWDSIYARALAGSLKEKLATICPSAVVDIYPYLRGLDGALTEQAAPPAKPATAKAARLDKAATGNDTATQVEWPEGPQQQDYVRRLVEQSMRQVGNARAVQAIGIFGSDVHDKLVLAQALRETFPDRVLFTTDLDARLLHPNANRYTRNLVVATSLPLEVPRHLQQRIAPFRDAYQTATFLGTRYAVEPEVPSFFGQDGLGADIQRQLSTPALFEISSDDKVLLLDKGAVPAEQKEKREFFAVLAAIGLSLLGACMLQLVPGPAMAETKLWLSGGPPLKDPLRRTTVFLAMLQFAALAYAAGVIVELGVPDSLRAYGPVWLSLGTVAVVLLLFLRPGSRWLQEFRSKARPGETGVAFKLPVLHIVVLSLAFAALAFLFWSLTPALPSPADDVHEPFMPLNGVSAWPSHILRTLAIVLATWFFDCTWRNSADAAKQIQSRYFSTADATSDHWALKIPFWNWGTTGSGDAPLDGNSLWTTYRQSLRNWQRFWRFAFWAAVLATVVASVTNLLDGASPDVPARGISDRLLFESGLWGTSICVFIILIVVSDTILMTWWFIILLKSGRTSYPTETVEAFAAELGPKLQPLAATEIASRIDERRVLLTKDASKEDPSPDALGAPKRENSLLDDWIDTRLLAEQTAAIGRLILFPFVLVGLILVARSRLFDNWDDGSVVLGVVGLYLVIAAGLVILLNRGAESARQKSLERMEADLVWLKGAGKHSRPLADQFPTLIEQVRNLRRGAFAPFLEQPLVQAMLVPLGSAGGIKLLEYLLLGQTP